MKNPLFFLWKMRKNAEKIKKKRVKTVKNTPIFKRDKILSNPTKQRGTADICD
jgi:hypothetical protein